MGCNRIRFRAISFSTHYLSLGFAQCYRFVVAPFFIIWVPFSLSTLLFFHVQKNYFEIISGAVHSGSSSKQVKEFEIMNTRTPIHKLLFAPYNGHLFCAKEDGLIRFYPQPLEEGYFIHFVFFFCKYYYFRCKCYHYFEQQKMEEIVNAPLACSFLVFLLSLPLRF